MPIDVHHWSIRISVRIYLEHLIYTLSNQNVSLCGQKSVQLLKESRYICKFWRYTYIKYNAGQNLFFYIHLKYKRNNVNKLIIILVLVGAKLIGGWQSIWVDEMKIH